MANSHFHTAVLCAVSAIIPISACSLDTMTGEPTAGAAGLGAGRAGTGGTGSAGAPAGGKGGSIGAGAGGGSSAVGGTAGSSGNAGGLGGKSGTGGSGSAGAGGTPAAARYGRQAGLCWSWCGQGALRGPPVVARIRAGSGDQCGRGGGRRECAQPSAGAERRAPRYGVVTVT